MRNLLLSVVIIAATITTSFSQSKKGCDKKACGPENTKVAEAKIITNLREEIREVKSLIDKANIEVKEASIGHQAIKDLPLNIQGNADDAALLMLYMDITGLKQTLNYAADSPNYSSKALLVADLRSDLAEMKNQLISN